MASDTPREITQLLRQWQTGNREALDSVLALAYDELRAIAQGYLRRNALGATIQATGLVNELYLRLVRVQGAALEDRRHFYAFAAQLMRQILVDFSRRSRAQKRPSSANRVSLHPEMAWIDASGEDIVALNLAMDELEVAHPRKVRVIELRFFLGCTNEEVAELLNLSRPTVARDLEFAKVWLYRRLSGAEPSGPA